MSADAVAVMDPSNAIKRAIASSALTASRPYATHLRDALETHWSEVVFEVVFVGLKYAKRSPQGSDTDLAGTMLRP